MLCSFKLVLEQKTGKEIPESSRLEFIEKCSANNFVLPDAQDNTSGLLYTTYSRFTFVENTISNSPEITRAKFLGNNGLFCFTKTCQFGGFKNLFQ